LHTWSLEIRSNMELFRLYEGSSENKCRKQRTIPNTDVVHIHLSGLTNKDCKRPTYIHKNVHISMNRCIYTNKCTYKNEYVYIFVNVYIHAYKYRCLFEYTYIRTCIYTHIYIHIYVYICTYIFMYSHSSY
jgi:hypothetical protein